MLVADIVAHPALGDLSLRRGGEVRYGSSAEVDAWVRAATDEDDRTRCAVPIFYGVAALAL